MTSIYGVDGSLLNSAILNWMQHLAPQGIMLTDTDLKIVAWNGWLEERSGRRAKDLLGKNLFEVYPDLIDRGLAVNYQAALDGQTRLLSHGLHGYLIALPARDFRDYTEMQQSVRISPLSQDGKVTGTLTIIDDVTERVVREAQLQKQLEERSKLLVSEKAARREAEEANRLKDEFLTTISHELRTPLTAIVGWSNLLRTGGLDEDAKRRAVEIIYRNAHSQAQLISDLLDVSRVISSKLILTIAQVNMTAAIEAALDAVRPEAKAKGIRLTSTIEPDLPMISGDLERLQQIIWNLLSNAIKFTPANGTVHVRLRRMETMVEITVTDSGIGIDPQFLPYVFDRFRQENSATTRAHGGLGLGLSIVRELTMLHEGSVRVASEGAGKGTTFVVLLPIRGPQNTRHGNESDGAYTDFEQLGTKDSSESLEGTTVLVVDDEEDTRDFVRAVLESSGAAVLTSSSAADAIRMFEAERPDFLISDIGMPEEDGFSLIQSIRSLPKSKGGDTPAAALTAYAREEDRQRILRAGFQICVLKPVNPSQLISAVASHMRRSSAHYPGD